ncbi:hypothetical protein CXF68_17755 [Tenacibaculum sp. Bg11-29]|jgi:hypothetical protein|uniref:hypothetical protein n=1 Tax=Tenacibaculum sp. Bg11-29 TaxID=2058306 RepID=UPI000C32F899|nr:hypothetical protein [Tenacibaculum sp. Bg11-29]PKH52424.1 hypothetical protein CXF68_17755 [Tenacibaculum sp. Bg11-29]
MKAKNQIFEIINTLKVKEKTFHFLGELIKNNPTIDNRETDKLKYEFSGIEIKIPNDFNGRIVIIGKVNIFEKNKIGFYEYHLNISGEFLDEFYVFSE